MGGAAAPGSRLEVAADVVVSTLQIVNYWPKSIIIVVPPRRCGPHSDSPQSIGLLWTSGQLVAETST